MAHCQKRSGSYEKISWLPIGDDVAHCMERCGSLSGYGVAQWRILYGSLKEMTWRIVWLGGLLREDTWLMLCRWRGSLVEMAWLIGEMHRQITCLCR